MKRFLYSKEILNKAIELRKQGVTITEIISITGIKKPSLMKLFRVNGIKLPKDVADRNIIGARWKNHKPVVDGKKKCSKCKKNLPLEMYANDIRRVSGKSPRCRSCGHSYYLINQDRIKACSKNNRKNNKELFSLKDKIYREKRKKEGTYRPSNWHLRYPEKARASGKAYRERNRDEVGAKSAMYRAKKRNATPKWLSKKHKKEILEFYKNCPEGYEVDHIVPIGSEFVCGLHVPWNLQYLKSHLNHSKRDAFVDLNAIGVCHQFKMKIQTKDEDLLLGRPFGCELKDFFFLKETLSQEHKAFINRYEWLGNLGYINKPEVYVARHVTGVLGGVVVIDEPNFPTLWIEKGKEALIQRGATASWTPKNLGSKLLMFGIKNSVKTTKRRVFTGYADPEAGEVGTIYQACNFTYLGHRFGSKTVYLNSEGKKRNSKYFRKTSSNMRYAKELGIKWLPEWTKENGFQNLKAIPKEIRIKLAEKSREDMLRHTVTHVLPKGKYMILVGIDRKEDRELREKYKNKITPFPYPKRGTQQQSLP